MSPAESLAALSTTVPSSSHGLPSSPTPQSTAQHLPHCHTLAEFLPSPWECLSPFFFS